MRAFIYETAADSRVAANAGAGAAFLAGGTTLLDLMKLDVMRPERVVDISGLSEPHGRIVAEPGRLRLGALARMADAARHPAVRQDYPVIVDSLLLAASPQIRNMATLGGNVLQRTRCSYFRDTSWSACNKRSPGSGCAAMQGVNRNHAVLGVDDSCIALYPGDLGVVLAAFGATVELAGPGGARRIAFEDLHRPAEGRPHIETTLRPGEIITGFAIPAAAWTRRSLYLKVRDRASYEFALASAAVALDLDGDQVRGARIALGGVAYRPRRAVEAEAALVGKPLTEANAESAARAAFAGAVTQADNAYKPELGRRTLVRALLQAHAMEA